MKLRYFGLFTTLCAAMLSGCLQKRLGYSEITPAHAWGVKAFMDYADQTGSTEYDEVTRSVLDYYQNKFTLTPEGRYFWYSNSGFDNKNVRNISAMLAGQYARAGTYFSRQDYADKARLAFQSVWAARNEDGSTTRWTYSDFSSAPNDSIHAAYLVYGLSVYARTNRLRLDLNGAYRFLSGFISSGKAFEFSSLEHVKPALKNRSARSWGVGMLAFVLPTPIERLRPAAFCKHWLHTNLGLGISD